MQHCKLCCLLRFLGQPHEMSISNVPISQMGNSRFGKRKWPVVKWWGEVRVWILGLLSPMHVLFPFHWWRKERAKNFPHSESLEHRPVWIPTEKLLTKLRDRTQILTYRGASNHWHTGVCCREGATVPCLHGRSELTLSCYPFKRVMALCLSLSRKILYY